MQQVDPDLHDAKAIDDLLPYGSYLTEYQIKVPFTMKRALGDKQLKMRILE
jgi:hypothetical protein